MKSVTNRTLILATASLWALAAGSVPAWAQDAADEPAPAAGEPADVPVEEYEPGVIVVIGERMIVASLADAQVEQTYDEDAVASYAASSVGEILDAIQQENGDSDPALLVNGRPVRDRGDVADLPAEAIQRVEMLPRGTAQRVGGTAGQRVYNVVLRNAFTSFAATGSLETATEGGWDMWREEGQFTRIKGQNRFNITLRGSQSSTLLESERDYIPRTANVPYSPLGNILPAFADEIDPALSALAGYPVTVVAVPAGARSPSLADLLAGANTVNPALEGDYRTLRGAGDTWDLSVSGNRALNERMALSYNARAGWSSSQFLSGLPSAQFLMLPSHPDSPFAVPVYLAFNDPLRPLTSGFDATSQAASATLSASLGRWQTRLMARFDRRSQDFTYQYTGPVFGADAIIPDEVDPYSGIIAGRIPVISQLATSRTTTFHADFEAEGPLLSLWAGEVQGRVGVGAGWIDFSADSLSGERSLNRPDRLVRGGITVPLTGRDPAFLSFLGESDLSFDYAVTDLGRFGSVERQSLVLDWLPASWLRLTASTSRDGRPLSLETQSAPSTISPNTPYFDPLTGESVYVTAIYGGAGELINEELRSRSLAMTLLPWPKYKLQFESEYIVDDLRNQVGALPPPTTAIVLAFPDRFIRDSDGTLVTVDNRSINFFRQRSERLRLGLRFNLPLGAASSVKGEDGKTRRTPATTLQFNASHIVLLTNELTIREGLPVIVMRAGGAVGIGGGLPRSISSAGLAVTHGSSGLRLDYRRRGGSTLIYGLPADPDRLEFSPIATLDVKAYADLGQIFRDSKLAKGTRVTLAVDNLFNDRQQVTDQTGATPQAFQPVRRDPVGRTVMIELRKLF